LSNKNSDEQKVQRENSDKRLEKSRENSNEKQHNGKEARIATRKSELEQRQKS